MTHETRSFGIDSGIRVAQGLALGQNLLGGICDGLAEVSRLRAAEELSAVDALSGEVLRLRELLAGAQAEASRARAEAATLGAALDATTARARRAEAGLRTLTAAVAAGRVRRA
ncbi:hypothetical protein ASG63_16630 [Methylobacterium sp. Leaf94]|uniref:hypothetical protein n=1 Tax=Methylobacterium sp. Leaf94 TaxID=1736250 RepID=UPI0006F293D1|nr:hypothetical protein [Methylobacterium sp. Leaf94]KQU31119.1 hypothetical protein ASG63_16630 [Methylobacterium sp. Leaf94]